MKYDISLTKIRHKHHLFESNRALQDAYEKSNKLNGTFYI